MEFIFLYKIYNQTVCIILLWYMSGAPNCYHEIMGKLQERVRRAENPTIKCDKSNFVFILDMN